MTRTGPNQDINDPTTLENLRLATENVAVKANDHNNAYNGITGNESIIPKVHPNNIRIIPISTLLKKIDGSDIEITGFTTSGTYRQENIDLYIESVINTYINQPERFRDYYDDIISIINSWSDRDNGSPIITTFVTSGSIDSDVSNDHRGWAESNIRIEQKDGYVTINQSEIPISIDWLGTGPVNYNSGTYPQLISAFNNMADEMGSQLQPYFDVTTVLNQGYYTGASQVDGFSTAIDLFERTDWNDSSQKFAQISNTLPGQSSLDSPILISSSHLVRIPVMVSNFTNNSQNIAYTVKVTMTPRNTSNRIFQNFHLGFVNKRIWIIGLHTNDFDANFIQHNGSNTSDVNDMLTSSFDLQISDFITVARRSLAIATVQVGFINQLNIRNGSFSDWDTENLLSDINIQFNVDGHSINQDFDQSIERNMWNNPPSP